MLLWTALLAVAALSLGVAARHLSCRAARVASAGAVWLGATAAIVGTLTLVVALSSEHPAAALVCLLVAVVVVSGAITHYPALRAEQNRHPSRWPETGLLQLELGLGAQSIDPMRAVLRDAASLNEEFRFVFKAEREPGGEQPVVKLYAESSPQGAGRLRRHLQTRYGDAAQVRVVPATEHPLRELALQAPARDSREPEQR